MVEQRILEQSVRLPEHGGVTGWAALRWRGARFFDGTDRGGRRTLPVPLLVGGNIRPDPRVALNWEQFAPSEREVVAGFPCATVQRAVFDEMRRLPSIRHAVLVLDMAAAAGLISVGLMSQYVLRRPAWTGVPRVRKALLLATDDSRSPPETALRLLWHLDAGLPLPLCNQPVFSRDGTLLGYPDLFDPELGVVGEYDGADHLRDDRRRRDTERETLMRDHDLEYFRVVKGDFGAPHTIVSRIHRARARARRTPVANRRWTLEPPPWFTPEVPLHDRLIAQGLGEALTHA